MGGSTWKSSERSPCLRVKVHVRQRPNLMPTAGRRGSRGKKGPSRRLQPRGISRLPRGSLPRPALTGRLGFRERPGMCRTGSLHCRCLGKDSRHPMQKAQRFPPRPPGDGKVGGRELDRASKLSLEGKQPRRPGERSCWRAPRTGREGSQGYNARGRAAFLQA